MKYYFFIFLFSSTPLLGFGNNSICSSYQTIATIKGKILDKKTNAPIPFVNIGIPTRAQGTVSDEAGNYELDYTDSEDEVTISAIGYFTQKKSVNELLENGTIFLEEQVHEIPSIKITANRLGKEKRFGKKNKDRGLSVGFGNAKLGCAIGSVISIKKETYLKSANFKINHADGDSLLFRVNIYHFEKGKIGENILNENVIIYAPQKRGVLTVDLSPYELIIDHDVLLSLEWIKDDNGKGNEGITFDTKKRTKSNIWTKRTSQAEFKVNTALGRLGFKRKSLCFWLMGKEVVK